MNIYVKDIALSIGANYFSLRSLVPEIRTFKHFKRDFPGFPGKCETCKCQIRDLRGRIDIKIAFAVVNPIFDFRAQLTGL